MSHTATITQSQDRILAISASKPARKIGVLGHYGNKNLGDEAIVAALIQNIRVRYPNAEIVCFSANPQDTQQRHGVPAFPVRRMDKPAAISEPAVSSESVGRFGQAGKAIKTALKKIPFVYASLKGSYNAARSLAAAVKEVGFLGRSTRSLKDMDLLLIAGSQQLSDHYGGPWGFPYTLFKWCLLARLRGAKIAFVGLGAGPIRSPLSRFFIHRALSVASYRSYRTEASRETAGPVHGVMNDPVMPDSAYSMHVGRSSVARWPAGRPVVGINPVPYYDSRYWHTSDPAIYSDYVQKMANFAGWLIERGYRVWFFPTQLIADPLVITDIKKTMSAASGSFPDNCFIDQPVTGLEDLAASMASADFIVANRFHGVIVPFLLSKPVLALAYHKKTREIMEQMGLAQYVLNSDTFQLESLKQGFLSLEANREEITRQIALKTSEHRRMLDEQYESLFNLLEDKSSLGAVTA